MIAAATPNTETRTQQLGCELFEQARKAEPNFWTRAWWEARLLDYVSADPQLQTQLFRFMEAVPHLRDDADIAAHLSDYLDPQTMNLPLPLRFALLFGKPDTLPGRALGSVIRAAAFEMATCFITGTNTAEAIENAQRLRRQQMAFTLDVLGEATIGDSQADAAAAVYMELIESLGAAARNWEHIPLLDEGRHGPMPRANISIKLSALDPVFDPVAPERVYDTVTGRLRPLLDRARQLGVFVNVDMEQYRYRDMTLDMFKRLMLEPAYRDWTDVGIVVQAYLQDAEDDLRGLLDWVDRRGAGVAVRLVKGAYWDTETTYAVRQNRRIPVWTKKWQSDVCYERLTRIMLENADRIRPAFASHNVRSLAHAMAAAESLGLTTRDYELQMLAGMGDPLKFAAVQMGQCVRVYCPYGDLLRGMAYLIRRLLENTSNDSFLKQGFGDRGAYARLLADPETARPPSAALPRRSYQDTFEEEPMTGFENASHFGFGTPEHRRQLAAALADARHTLGKTYPLIVEGKRLETGAWIESHNPAKPDEIIGRVAAGDAATADRAVAGATRALTGWSARSAYDRAEILRRAAGALESQRLAFTALLILEIGKSAADADAEVAEAIDYCNYHAALIEQLADRPRRRNVPGEDNMLLYDPCGVSVVLCSWDFPLALLAGMVTASIAVGNTVVLKPSSEAPVVAARFMELLTCARLPDGVVNYLPGAGADVGRHLVAHPDVHLVALCGSRDTALDVIPAAARIAPRQRHIKRTIVDAGAKNAIIVDHDVDIDEAVKGVMESAFAFSGQKCTACSRAIVHTDIHEAFCRKFAEAAKTIRLGNPADPAMTVGPVIDANAQARIAEYIDLGRKTARVVFEADTAALPNEGHYLAPIVFADVDPKSPLAQEEIFGPVLVVLQANDFEHALALANDTDYALTGGVYSRSPSHIERARWEFRVGNLYINRKITGSQVDVQPYGGSKLSGDGARLGAVDYLLQYCRPRTISENTVRHGLTKPETSEAPLPT